MLPFFQKGVSDKTIPGWTAAAIIISAVSLAFAIGVARWSWLILDEQLVLRREFMDLKLSQEQLNIQFDFWGAQIQKEREELRK